MALPKVNETLNFTMKIPSTGKRVKYRPYLVKEEKVLLQAFESGDIKTCLEAMVDTLDACLDPKQNVDVGDLATFDIEYMFTQVRAKSVGETSTILIKCKDCEEQNQYRIELDDLEVEMTDKNNIIEINDDISVEMKYPTYRGFIEQDLGDLTEENSEAMFQVLASSVAAILTKDDRIDATKEDPKDVVEFLESMTAGQLKKVTAFLEELPSMRHLAKFNCQKCGVDNELELKGLADFF